MTLRSAQTLSNYPLSIMATETEESVLGGWRRTADVLMAMSAALVIAVLIAAFMIARWWRVTSAPFGRRKQPIRRSLPSWR